jgi:glutamate synthase domain-containing protein 2
MYQTKHALRRNFPFVGRGRWVMEFLRPFFRQYFFESETDGVPISRMFRSVIYQRAKGAPDAVPYGTKLDTQAVGYEWIGHSLAAIHASKETPKQRIDVGGPDCLKPYSASVFNISAMSYGSLSGNAIEALNKGAKKGGFFHNTGEGSVSPSHLKHGGDLVWQIGTGYFGCRTADGKFDGDSFAKTAIKDNIKMIEIKLSQGAKPGHGGILPAHKNTIEIAQIRQVEPGTRVESPPTHSSFSTPLEMMQFIKKLRDLSGGKPIGFKLCIGRKSEFIALCKAMIETKIQPDFITVDGGEGGTGAAPLEYSNSVGMPLREALVFVVDVLNGFGLKKEIRVIASGKTFTGFHLVKKLALGADMCNSARGMMVALGCVQSLICHTNECPTGIATQDPAVASG